jgi:hypothetical protein
VERSPSGGAEPLSGQIQVLQALKDQPPEIRDFAAKTYAAHASQGELSNFFDSACATLKMVEMKVKLPGETQDNLWRRADFSGCIDQDGLIQFGANTALFVRGRDLAEAEMSDEEIREYCLCVGQLLAEQFARRPVDNLVGVRQYLTQAFNQCERKLQGRE